MMHIQWLRHYGGEFHQADPTCPDPQRGPRYDYQPSTSRMQRRRWRKNWWLWLFLLKLFERSQKPSWEFMNFRATASEFGKSNGRTASMSKPTKCHGGHRFWRILSRIASTTSWTIPTFRFWEANVMVLYPRLATPLGRQRLFYFLSFSSLTLIDATMTVTVGLNEAIKLLPTPTAAAAPPAPVKSWKVPLAPFSSMAMIAAAATQPASTSPASKGFKNLLMAFRECLQSY